MLSPAQLLAAFHVAVVWGAILAPGILLAQRHLDFLAPAPRLTVGAGLSYALFSYAAYLDTRFLGLGTTIPWLWLGLLGWAAWHCRGVLEWVRLRQAADAAWRGAPHAILLVLACLGVRLIPLPCSILPPGFDPSNHLLLARLICVRQCIPADWTPFEEVALNYPCGLHNVLALMHQVAGVELSVAWKSLYPVFGTLTVLVVYSLSRGAGDTPRRALWIAAAYGLLANNGSLEYYGWGGMVNQAGVFLAATTLLLACELNRHGKRSVAWSALAGLPFTAAFLTHHHVMLSCGIMLVAVMGVSYWRCRDLGLHRDLFLALAASAGLGCFYLLPLLARVGQAKATGLFSYVEEYYGAVKVFCAVGPAFVIGAVAGLPRFLRDYRSSGRGLAIVTALAVFLGIFVLIEYVWQGGYYLVHGARNTPLVPSRFLTNGVLFLAFPVGVFLEWLFGLLQARSRTLALAAAGALLCQTAFYVRALCTNVIGPEEYSALVWVRDNTPPDAYIINNSRWVCFFCWREVAITPLSASEAMSPDKRRKHDAIILESNRPVYLMGYLPGYPRVFEAGEYSVYRVK